MNSPVIRMVIAAVIVIGIAGGAWLASIEGGVHRDIRLPDESITTIPMQLGKWKGKDQEINEKLFGKIAGNEVVSRSYRSASSDDVITLHCASFNKFWRRVPHSPKVCYPTHGWTTIGDEPFPLGGPTDPDGNQPTAQLVKFEKDGSSSYVLFWFQFGDYVIYDTSQLASARWKMRNAETWPPIVKMMLETRADRPDRAKRQLQEFADLLHEKTRTFK